MISSIMGCSFLLALGWGLIKGGAVFWGIKGICLLVWCNYFRLFGVQNFVVYVFDVMIWGVGKLVHL